MISLELITPALASTFRDVRLRALVDTPTAFGSTYARESVLTDAEWIERAQKWTREGAVGYLAMDAGAAYGIAAGLLDADDATRAHLLSMWVAPSHRQLGVGRMLVEAVADWARTQRAVAVLLMVTSNNDGAMAFYRRLGFTETGNTEPYPNDPALFEYEMSRPIP